MSDVQVLLPSGNLKPLGGSAASNSVEAASATTSKEGCFPRPSGRRPAPHDSESDSSAYPQPKKLQKCRRRNKKKKKTERTNNAFAPVFKPYAPFNSNQFLMEEYDTLHYEDLDINTSPRSRQECSDGGGSLSGAPAMMGGDSRWEEFCTKEFLGTYQAITVQRLDNLTKAELVEEYLTLEDELDGLKRRLKNVILEDQVRGMIIECDQDSSDLQPGEVLLDAETAAKISVFKGEIRALERQNKELIKLNSLLRSRRASHSSSSSSTSSSRSWSSSSSSSSSSSDSSSDSEDQREGDDNNNRAAVGGVESKSTPAPLDSLSASVNMTCEVIHCSGDSGSSAGAAEQESPVENNLLPVSAGGIATLVKESEEELLQGEQVSERVKISSRVDCDGPVKCAQDNDLNVQDELLDSGLDDNNEILSEDNDC